MCQTCDFTLIKSVLYFRTELLALENSQNKTYAGSRRAYNFKNRIWGPMMVLGSRRFRKILATVGWGEERAEPRRHV